MTEREKISVPQMLSAAFLSVALLPVGVNRAFMGSGDFFAFAGSALLCMAMQALLALPLFLLKRRRPVWESSGFLTRAAAVYFSVYFLFMSCFGCTLLFVFLKNVKDPLLPAWLLIPAAAAVFCFGAQKGVETLARVSAAVLLVTGLFYLFMAATALPSLRRENLHRSASGSAAVMLRGAVSLFARGPVLPVWFLLEENTNGKKRGKLFLWIAAGYGLLAGLLFLMAGVMGDYAATQLFPLYILASVSGAGPFTRLEAIYLGLWFLCMLIQCCVFFCLACRCASRLLPEKKRGSVLFFFAAVTAGASLFATQKIGPERVLFDTKLLFWTGLTAGFLLPLALLLGGKGRKRMKKTALLMSVVLCLGMLSGCAVPLSEKTIVQGVCVDREGDRYTAALLAVLPGEERQAVSFRGEGETISEAIGQIRSENGVIPIFSHEMAVIFSASCGADMESALAYFVRYYEIRPTVELFWTESRAEELCTLHSESRFITDDLKACYVEDAAEGGRSAALMDFTDLFLKGKGYMPRVRLENGSLLPDGTVLFRNGAPEIFLNEAEGELFALLRGDRKETVCTAQSGSLGKFTASLSRFVIRQEEGALCVSCQAALTETEKGMGKSPGENDYREMERMLEESLKEAIRGLAEKGAVEEAADLAVTVSLNRTEEVVSPLF